MIKEQSTAKGFTLMSTANLLCRCLSIIYIPILTGLLGDIGNGIYSAGYTVYTLLFEIAYMGIPVAISRMVAKYNAEKRYNDSLRTLKFAGGLLLLVGIICAAVMAIFCNQIADKILATKDSWMTILLLAPAILFSSVSGAIRGFFQGQKNMTHTSVSQIIEQVLNAVSTPLLAYLFIQYAKSQSLNEGLQLVYGAGGGALGTFVGSLGSSLYLFIMLAANYKYFRQLAKEDRDNNSIDRESNIKLVKIIIFTAVPIVLGAAMVYLANLIDVSFIKNRLITAGFADESTRNTIYGIFSTQYHKTTNIVLGIVATLPATILPGISQIASKNNPSLLKSKMNNSVKASFLVSMPCCAGLCILAPFVMRMLFPNNYNTNPAGVVSPSTLIMVGVWSIVIVSIVQILTSILQGVGDFKSAPINMTIGLAVKLALNYWLISVKALNIMGAIISTYICYIVVLILDYLMVIKRTKIRISFINQFIRPFITTAVMSAVVFVVAYGLRFLFSSLDKYNYTVNLLITVLAIGFGGLSYFFCALKFKVIGKNDVSSVPILGSILKKPFMTKLINKII